MPLKYYENKNTGEIKRTLKGSPGEDWKEVLKSPGSKMMECANKATGKSKLKDMKKILTERARNHTRDVELDDVIELNRHNKFGTKQNLLNRVGQKRKKIDDL